MPSRVLFVGNPSPTHIGAHFRHAARDLGVDSHLEDSSLAYDGWWPITKMNWHLRGRRPSRLQEFGRSVVEACRRFKPQCLLATGIAPVPREALEQIRDLGIARYNFLTDDPWNPAHQAPWFFHALPLYDHIFSPRHANLAQLSRIVPRVTYLPFAYSPHSHFVEDAGTDSYASDIMFAGSGDDDRLPYISALLAARLEVGLYGGEWNRFPQTRKYWRGFLDEESLRKAVSGAKIGLCLVRRANRDDHVMRTFELPSMKSCLLVENTSEHRKLFGDEGEAALFFSSPGEMLEKTKWLLSNERERQRLALHAHHRIRRGGHTYRERLSAILGTIDS